MIVTILFLCLWTEIIFTQDFLRLSDSVWRQAMFRVCHKQRKSESQPSTITHSHSFSRFFGLLTLWMRNSASKVSCWQHVLKLNIAELSMQVVSQLKSLIPMANWISLLILWSAKSCLLPWIHCIHRTARLINIWFSQASKGNPCAQQVIVSGTCIMQAAALHLLPALFVSLERAIHTFLHLILFTGEFGAFFKQSRYCLGYPRKRWSHVLILGVDALSWSNYCDFLAGNHYKKTWVFWKAGWLWVCFVLDA